MRLVTCSIVGAACALGVLFAPIAQAANAPLCFAIAENYNKCMRQHQYGRGGHGGYGPGYGQGYGQGYGHGYGHGYGRGYRGDYDGGDPGDYDGDGGYGGFGGYGGGPGRGHYDRSKAACAVWIAQMQASGCFN
ncbi:hypothetical protein [Methylocystis sp. SC2]|uniref:hypothetical protein n=1 Tax=Methylocystis sp. (strain SC2) TaxID=187303 RepID=UPI0011D1D140|nr:hypothetical protein [Methylocystis sp. SC2]